MNEIKELVGIAESRDPTDRDRFHLKTLVRKLKQTNDSLKEENFENVQEMVGTKPEDTETTMEEISSESFEPIADNAYKRTKE